MTVVVLSACPPGLRGELTRWLLEVTPGVFIGFLTVRVRDHLWLRIVENVGRGRALMVEATHGEQRLSFRVHGHEWEPTDFDGVFLMMRRGGRGGTSPDGGLRRPPENWSIAARRRRFGNSIDRATKLN